MSMNSMSMIVTVIAGDEVLGDVRSIFLIFFLTRETDVVPERKVVPLELNHAEGAGGRIVET